VLFALTLEECVAAVDNFVLYLFVSARAYGDLLSRHYLRAKSTRMLERTFVRSTNRFSRYVRGARLTCATRGSAYEIA
jgi:hypothetical protein